MTPDEMEETAEILSDKHWEEQDHTSCPDRIPCKPKGLCGGCREEVTKKYILLGMMIAIKGRG